MVQAAEQDTPEPQMPHASHRMLEQPGEPMFAAFNVRVSNKQPDDGSKPSI